MDRFDAMRIFTRIVELRSFTQAAHDLGYPKATVTHAIKQLEARLHVRLLQRTTRQVTPTLDGEAYYQRCVRLLADLEETESVFTSAAQQPAGKLRIDMHSTLGMHFVMPVLDRFCARYPLIELEIGMGDRLVDLVREGVDCVLRVGELGDSSMVARRVALLEQMTCASPAYLAAHGTPQTAAELTHHQTLSYLMTEEHRWHLVGSGGEEHVHTATSRLRFNSVDCMVDAALAGLGLAIIPIYLAIPHLRDGRLVQVLPEFKTHTQFGSHLYACYTPSRVRIAKVRVMLQALTELLEPVPPWAR